jgi:hypothetical protein
MTQTQEEISFKEIVWAFLFCLCKGLCRKWMLEKSPQTVTSLCLMGKRPDVFNVY